jgi:hypothetical protein
VTTVRDLLATIIGYPTPPHIPQTENADNLIAQWRTYMGTHPRDGTGDFEDFFEMAARLDAALHSGAGTVWIHDTRTTQGLDANFGQATMPVDRLHDRINDDLVLYGPLLRYSHLNLIVDSSADRYFDKPAFIDNAGRVTYLAGFRSPSMEVAEAMSLLAEAGHDEVFVKATKAKHGFWRIPAFADQAKSEEVLLDSTDWSMVSAEGSPNAFSVQEIIEMHYEYRVFVVNGVPVTGAGCIEEHTPLDNDGSAFSPLVRRVRGSSETIESRPDLTDVFSTFASQVAAQAASCMPEAYVVDLAMSGGRPVVIEFNAMTNSGLYATNPRLVTQAIVGP